MTNAGRYSAGTCWWLPVEVFVLSLLRRALNRPCVICCRWCSAEGLDVSAQPVVRVGTGDWAPYVDQQREDGGALARLIREIFNAAGYQVEFVYHPGNATC